MVYDSRKKDLTLHYKCQVNSKNTALHVAKVELVFNFQHFFFLP